MWAVTPFQMNRMVVYLDVRTAWLEQDPSPLKESSDHCSGIVNSSNLWQNSQSENNKFKLD